MLGRKPSQNPYLWIWGKGYVGYYFPDYVGDKIIFDRLNFRKLGHRDI
jgi:hypothetical protein